MVENTPTCVFQQLVNPCSVMFVSWQLCILSSVVDTDSEEARKTFPLTLSVKVNLCWRFPEPQVLGNEPPQTGQSGEGGGSSLWDCHAWRLWGCKGNDREMGGESGEDGPLSSVSGKHAFVLIDTHGQAIALQTRSSP